MLRKFALVLGVALLSACAGASEQLPTPTAVSTLISLAPSVTPSQTIMPATPSIAPSPTAFITPPAANEFANLPILMYHHLSDLPNTATELQLTWTIAPKNFEAQMEWLSQHGYHSISMAQLGAFLKRKQPLPVKPVVITFDDGWEEQYAIAYLVLKKFNLLATFYVYTRFLDKSLFLSWKQVEEMSGAGMEIGAHTLTHPHLRTLSPDAAAQEINESKIALEKRLSKPVTTFAYPFGEYNGLIVEMVKRAGFDTAATINPGYRQRADEIYLLHRIRVSYHDTLQDFTSRLPQ